jgi:hypothetical protein
VAGPQEPAGAGGGNRSSGEGGSDYTGAVYGSLLAASVVASAGLLGPLSALRMILMLLITGLVFWATHVYSRLAGEHIVGQAIGWREVRRVARHERPIVDSAALPAIAVALGPVLRLDLTAAEWLALGVAVGQQVFWACLGAARARASRGQIAVEGAVSLCFGLIIVAAKVGLKR